jgi:hypothetical protein
VFSTAVLLAIIPNRRKRDRGYLMLHSHTSKVRLYFFHLKPDISQTVFMLQDLIGWEIASRFPLGLTTQHDRSSKTKLQQSYAHLCFFFFFKAVCNFLVLMLGFLGHFYSRLIVIPVGLPVILTTLLEVQKRSHCNSQSEC